MGMSKGPHFVSDWQHLIVWAWNVTPSTNPLQDHVIWTIWICVEKNPHFSTSVRTCLTSTQLQYNNTKSRKNFIIVHPNTIHSLHNINVRRFNLMIHFDGIRTCPHYQLLGCSWAMNMEKFEPTQLLSLLLYYRLPIEMLQCFLAF